LARLLAVEAGNVRAMGSDLIRGLTFDRKPLANTKPRDRLMHFRMAATQGQKKPEFNRGYASTLLQCPKLSLSSVLQSIRQWPYILPLDHLKAVVKHYDMELPNQLAVLVHSSTTTL